MHFCIFIQYSICSWSWVSRRISLLILGKNRHTPRRVCGQIQSEINTTTPSSLHAYFWNYSIGSQNTWEHRFHHCITVIKTLKTFLPTALPVEQAIAWHVFFPFLFLINFKVINCCVNFFFFFLGWWWLWWECTLHSRYSAKFLQSGVHLRR